MLLVSTEFVTGREVAQILGLVKGSTVHSKHLGKDIMAGLKTLVGGELHGYTEMLDEARQVATERMIREATALGADAVIGVRFASSAIMQGAAEILVYGTAVKLK